MNKTKSSNKTENDSQLEKFEKAKLELLRINKKINEFKVKSEIIFTSTEGKWLGSNSTYEARF